MINSLKSLSKDARPEDARKVIGNLIQPLLELSKCPDFVVNRGRYFGTRYVEQEGTIAKHDVGLSDADERTLIEFLKTFASTFIDQVTVIPMAGIETRAISKAVRSRPWGDSLDAS